LHQKLPQNLKTIKGKVTYLNKPFSHVNIGIKAEERGTFTTNNGSYSIRVKVGDLLQYSFVGYKTAFILVEDVTSVLNVEMNENGSKLDEVVVVAKKSKNAKDFKNDIRLVLFHAYNEDGKLIAKFNFD
jgi:hypothetical protein|tara:strand:- start:397 stop:783 length:387 start_codon:yes stop_codon:yes gene_type:complete